MIKSIKQKLIEKKKIGFTKKNALQLQKKSKN